MIYPPSMLKGLRKGDEITCVSFKYADAGSFVSIDADLSICLENTTATCFEGREGSAEYYLWHNFSEHNASSANLSYQTDLFYMDDQEIVFELEQPLVYNGHSLVLTAWSVNLGDEAQCVYSYITPTEDLDTMTFGSDTMPFDEVLLSGVNLDHQTPNRWLPVTHFLFNRSDTSGVVATGIPQDNASAVFYTMQGQRVEKPEAGFYIRLDASGARKTIIR